MPFGGARSGKPNMNFDNIFKDLSARIRWEREKAHAPNLTSFRTKGKVFTYLTVTWLVIAQ